MTAVEGNVSFHQVNLVSRITGEGGGRSFEGRGGLVLIKGEREYYTYVTTAVQAFIFYREKNSAFFVCLRRRASNRSLKLLMYQYV